MHLALRGLVRRLAGLQLPGAFHPLIQHDGRVINLRLRGHQFWELQQKPAGLGVYRNVGGCSLVRTNRRKQFFQLLCLQLDLR